MRRRRAGTAGAWETGGPIWKPSGAESKIRCSVSGFIPSRNRCASCKAPAARGVLISTRNWPCGFFGPACRRSIFPRRSNISSRRKAEFPTSIIAGQFAAHPAAHASGAGDVAANKTDLEIAAAGKIAAESCRDRFLMSPEKQSSLRPKPRLTGADRWFLPAPPVRPVLIFVVAVTTPVLVALNWNHKFFFIPLELGTKFLIFFPALRANCRWFGPVVTRFRTAEKSRLADH